MGTGNLLGATGAGTTIAIIDTGIDTDHSEFAGRLVSPWDFVDNDAVPDDHNGHGTHVAGTIAAANDGIGITGVAYNAKIMPLKVLGKNSNGNIDKVFPGIKTTPSKVYDYALGRNKEIPKRHLCLPIWYDLDNTISDKVLKELKN